MVDIVIKNIVKNIIKNIILSGVFLLMPVALASSITNTYLLKSTQLVDESLMQQNSLSFGDSWVENPELRVSTKDIESFAEQTYGVRLKFKNSKQRIAEKELLVLENQRQGIELKAYHLSFLHKSYSKLLRIFSNKHKIDRLNKQLTFAKQKASAYAKLANTSAFNPIKLQQENLDIDRLKHLLTIHKQSLNRMLMTIGLKINDKQAIQRFFNEQQQLIEVADIITVLDKLLSSQINPKLEALKITSAIAKKQMQREKAGLSTAVSLFELEYDEDKDSFGAMVGVRIPLHKVNTDILLKKSGYRRSQLDLEMKQRSLKDELTQRKLLIHQYYDEYQHNQLLLNSLNKRLKRIVKTGNVELIFSLKNEWLKYQSNHQQAYFNILREYVDYLAISGYMTEVPLRNWIYKSMPKLKG